MQMRFSKRQDIGTIVTQGAEKFRITRYCDELNPFCEGKPVYEVEKIEAPKTDTHSRQFWNGRTSRLEAWLTPSGDNWLVTSIGAEPFFTDDPAAAVVEYEKRIDHPLREKLEMTDKKYQGWTNYETWNVALWLNNEEGSYRYWRERAQEVKEEYPAEAKDTTAEQSYRTAKVALAIELEEGLEEGMPELEGFWGDLLRAAFSEVDWMEIADSFLEE